MASSFQKLTYFGRNNCLCSTGTYSQWLVHRRWLKGYKTKWKKREEREENIFQHVGKKTQPVERVYVWGNATTGALGN